MEGLELLLLLLPMGLELDFRAVYCTLAGVMPLLLATATAGIVPLLNLTVRRPAMPSTS
jgi:hypothetical protein